jgi:hypothetical protein
LEPRSTNLESYCGRTVAKSSFNQDWEVVDGITYFGDYSTTLWRMYEMRSIGLTIEGKSYEDELR